jgi:hypothetical protein
VLSAILAGCVISGCGTDLSREGERVVRAYCEAVVDAYRTGNADVVRPVATEKEWRKIFALIDLKRAEGMVLESELESLAIEDVAQPSPGLMTVVASERWRYFDRPIEIGQPPGTEFLVEMELLYTFVDVDGAWKMDQAITRHHEYIEPKGYLPPEHRPHGSEPGSDRP